MSHNAKHMQVTNSQLLSAVTELSRVTCLPPCHVTRAVPGDATHAPTAASVRDAFERDGAQQRARQQEERGEGGLGDATLAVRLGETAEQGPGALRPGQEAEPEIGREPCREHEVPQPPRIAAEAAGLAMEAVVQRLDAGQRPLAAERPAALGDDARRGQHLVPPLPHGLAPEPLALLGGLAALPLRLARELRQPRVLGVLGRAAPRLLLPL